MTLRLVESESEELFCSTCRSKIDFDPARIVIFKEYDQTIIRHFHYFFPCWDPDYILQRHPQAKIISAGFSFEEELMTTQVIRNMKKNIDLWV